MKKWQKLKTLLCAVFVLTAVTSLSLNAFSVSLVYDDLTYTGTDPLILENGVTYVSVRGVLGMRDSFEATWSPSARTASFRGVGFEMIAAVDEDHVVANGEAIHTDSPLRLIAGRVYAPVRAIAKALGAEVSYDGKTSTVKLVTKENYVGSASQSYSDDDFYWMARLISTASCDEPYAGKLMVGNVVLNRKYSPEFPNSVYSVIFDRTNAVQFTPTANGTIYNTPCDECEDAARAVLSGANRAGKALYFVNTDIATNSWVSDNRPVMAKVGNHTFYT